ncbi:MAG: His/Gly/Thr/Pro-type tRNA ligase C-terminal domain-containing protein [Desulfobacterales bacterium]|nr:His/Gly/Thr/Pro-type tRNA ligase C-terminal domain-containing protein [Desulfobacterales bacterium]
MLHRVILGAIERFIGRADRTLRRGLSALAVPGAGRPGDRDGQADPLRRGGLPEAAWMPGVRVERDFQNEKLGYKIREAQMQKTPFMLVIGDREVASGTDFAAAAGRARTWVPSTSRRSSTSSVKVQRYE